MRTPRSRVVAGILLAVTALIALLLYRAPSRQVERDAIAPSASGRDAVPATEVNVLPKSGITEQAAARAPLGAATAGTAAGSPDGSGRLPDATDVREPGILDGAMIVRTGQASIQVDSLSAGIAAVRQLAQRIGGYVANTSIQAGRDQPHTATLEIRLPSSRFDDAVAGLAPLGKVDFVNVSADDVGEEYVDVSARVDNAHRLEARLIDLLDRRTGKLSDVLQVEHELARVREEIERYEGRLRYLRSHAAVSSLAVTVHEPLPVVGQRGSGGVLHDAARQAWRNFIGFLAAIIASLGVVIPLGAILALAVWLVTRIARGRKPEPREEERKAA